jgi:UDP-N-acetylglucosamine 4,6-dehydratase
VIDGTTILITGGTGSFGNTFVNKVLTEHKPKSVIIYSRDEKKQFDMRNRLQNPIVTFMIGDVRDRERVYQAMKGVTYVFHAAALKQVPTCEFFPFEAVRTNILGTQNVLDAAEENGVSKVVVLSTDKAVYPINAMGMTKALLEKIMLAKARLSMAGTTFCGVRYGNVMFSRGSVLPLFMEQIQQKQPITITNPHMTRFLLPLPDAIDLVLFALEHGNNGDMFVRKSPAATIETIAAAMLEIYHSKYGIRIIGTREGEKLHETLVTMEDLMKAESFDDYFRIKNLEKLDYDKYFTEGRINHLPREGYTSENTYRLNLAETTEMIIRLQAKQEVLA